MLHVCIPIELMMNRPIISGESNIVLVKSDEELNSGLKNVQGIPKSCPFTLSVCSIQSLNF